MSKEVITAIRFVDPYTITLMLTKSVRHLGLSKMFPQALFSIPEWKSDAVQVAERISFLEEYYAASHATMKNWLTSEAFED